jgi:lysophospholipase L1-like esterase
VVTKTRYANENLIPEKIERRNYYKEFQRRTVEDFKAAGDKNIYFCDGSDFFGDDFDECTVDGVHPTDLGFKRIAQGIAPIIGRLLRFTELC